ncbi:MAG: VCBS repeat-containing protein, partial [Lacipirellulaceae bacterium]
MSQSRKKRGAKSREESSHAVKKQRHTPDATTSPSWPNLRGKAFLGVALALVVGCFLIWFLQAEEPEGERAGQPESSPQTNNGKSQIIAEIASLTTSADQQQSQLTRARLDPSRDGWETEVVAELAKSYLKKIAKLPVQGSEDSSIAEDIRFNSLRPEDLLEADSQASASDQIVVLRSAKDDDKELNYQGRAAFLRSLAALADVYSKPAKRHLHIKVIRVSLEGDSASTVAYFEADGHSNVGRIQQRATWHCDWKRLSGKSLQLTSLRAADYEEVLTSGTWMVDSTEEVLASNVSYQKQLRHGLNHWLTRLERIRGMHVFARNGLALGDVNGDGLDDVYVCQPGGLPNRLYIHQADGTALDRSREAGVDWLEQTSSALFLDLDNDGDQDLAAATVAGVLLME